MADQLRTVVFHDGDTELHLSLLEDARVSIDVVNGNGMMIPLADVQRALAYLRS